VTLKSSGCEPATTTDLTFTEPNETFPTLNDIGSELAPTRIEPPCAPAGVGANDGSPPRPVSSAETETALKPTSLTVSVPLISPAAVGNIINSIVHVPPAGTATAGARQLPPLIRNCSSSTSAVAGRNAEGPLFDSTRNHSGPGNHTATVPKSRLAMNGVGAC